MWAGGRETGCLQAPEMQQFWGKKRQLALAWRKQVIFWICWVLLHSEGRTGHWDGAEPGALSTHSPADPPLGCSPHPQHHFDKE